MRRLSSCLAIAGAALVLVPAAAQGSTLFTAGSTIAYFADPGETNVVTLERSGANFVFTDTGATITPAAPCVTVTIHQATCPAEPIEATQLSLDDLDDQATLASSASSMFQVVLFGEGGADRLTNSSYIPLIGLFGGLGDDTIEGGPIEDQVQGDEGNDTIDTGPGNDFIADGPGDDVERGGPGSDFFVTDDTIDGADTYIGGPGSDALSYGRGAGVALSPDDVANDGEGCPGAGCENDNIASDFEQLQGGRGPDTLIGGPRSEFLGGSAGNDVIDGGAGVDNISGDVGDDVVSGGADRDFISGGEGADVYDGGPGDDSLTAGFSDFGLDLLGGGDGTDTVTADVNSSMRIELDGTPNDGITDPALSPVLDNVGVDVENVTTGTGTDTLIGNDAANVLSAGAGNDTILGGSGSDTVTGADGDDTVDGGSGSDTLTGDAGADTLTSRDKSADQVDCGSSVDTVVADSKDKPKASCETVQRGSKHRARR